METDGSLSFNFHVGAESKRKEKIVVRGNTVRERSRKRKHLKLLKKQEDTDELVETSSPEETTPSSPGKLGNTIAKPKGMKKNVGVTSSLFTKNPDVPVIEEKEVSQITEDIFSHQKFSELDILHPHMVKNLETRIGHSTMTAIQFSSIPAIIDCKNDVLVQSQTGSGKTLAYAIPVVNNLQSERPKISRSDGTFALIIVPTRELAIQSFECLLKLVYPFTWIVPGCLMGGEKRKAEKARIRKGINILVATPGRLQDHLDKTESLNLKRLKWIIIDEADRLLDLGYEKSLQEILAAVKRQCQFEHHTVLLSATLSKGVERLAGISLANPVRLSASDSMASVSSDEPAETESFAIPEGLSQKYIIVPMKLRLVTLSAFIMDKFINSSKPAKMIVFLSTHVSVDFHHEVFTSVVCRRGEESELDGMDSICRLDNVNAYKLHGEMQQSERTETFKEFVEAKSGVLFCTDVAARGLHLPRVAWIVQYTAPATCSEYIHRIGRTARAGEKGQSLLFLLPSESEYVPLLAQQNISLHAMDMHAVLQRLILTSAIQKTSKKTLHNQTITQNATVLQNAFEQYVLGDSGHAELAGKACLSFIRGYSTYPKSVKHIFNVKGLHLGHVAKSFALRQAPRGLGQKYGSQVEVRREQHFQKSGKKRRMDASKISEFGSGDILVKKKKKNISESNDV